MAQDEIASSVLSALGGSTNILTNTVCMTRLRVTLVDPQTVDYEALNMVPSVLGTATRGNNGLEVVFGPAIIDAVYHSFIRLSGIAAGTDALFPMSRQESNLRVTINPAKATLPTESETQPESEEPPESHKAPITHEDLSILESIFDNEDDQSNSKAASTRSLLVINGPNLNLLGIREPDLYGVQDYPTMLQLCKDAAKEAGFDRCVCFQSNHEGDLVDVIQDAYGMFDGIVINPGAYTHTSIALLDVLKAVSIPTVEVHISAVDDREDFRKVSFIREACFETVSGLGIEGYRKAIHDLAEHLGI